MKIEKFVDTYIITFRGLAIEISHDTLMYAFGFEMNYFPGDTVVIFVISIFKTYIVLTIGKRRKIK